MVDNAGNATAGAEAGAANATEPTQLQEVQE